MRFILVFSALLFTIHFLEAQTSLEEMNLTKGSYTVGFRHYTEVDSSRTYSRIYDYTTKKVLRPIPISLWYPSNQETVTGEQLDVLNYFEILKEEEEWEHLPNEQLLNWFYYANTHENQMHLLEQTNAFKQAPISEGKFPVVIYTPSYQASSIENFALCELLASNGYVVISSPSRGTQTRWFSNNNAMEMETQARDIEFLIKEVTKLPYANTDTIALMGFSFGGLSNTIVQNRNDAVKALVSLDGTERYQYGLLKQSPFFNPQLLDVPYIHMAQKDIPEKVLIEDKIDAKLNTTFQLYDSITHSDAYRLKFHHLTHSYFSTLGVLFAQRDKRQDKSDLEIMDSYRMATTQTLKFLDATLKNDLDALDYLKNTKMDSNPVSKKSKNAQKKAFSFEDFNNLALKQNYNDLTNLYTTIHEEHPSFQLQEGKLNTLGLQLVFNPTRSLDGIAIFKLATQLYPNSSNLFDSLAEGYLFIGDTEKATENFKVSLQLNSSNQNARDRLKQLDE